MCIVHVDKWRIFCIWVFPTFSGRKFSGPDFYLLSTLCGPAATPWIWRRHYKRVKVNILSFGNSKMFSLFVSKNQERTGKNCITEWNVSKKSILGHGRQFGFPPSVNSRICPPVEDVFVPKCTFCFQFWLFSSTNRQIKQPDDKRICFQIVSLVWSSVFEVKGIGDHNINTS